MLAVPKRIAIAARHDRKTWHHSLQASGKPSRPHPTIFLAVAGAAASNPLYGTKPCRVSEARGFLGLAGIVEALREATHLFVESAGQDPVVVDAACPP
jgi:hypothetical protein